MNSASSPLDILWQPHTLMSVILIGEGLALILALAPSATGDRWIYFGLASLMVQWVAVLALCGLYALRGPLANKPMQQTAWIAMLMLVLSIWLVGCAAWFALQGLWPLASATWVGVLWRMTAIALIVGFLGIATVQNYWDARQLAVRVKQAELEALQARIHPHFLFNTLNTGVALIHARPGEAERVLLDLADLFRAALSGQREIDLGAELSLARRYLEIESLRFGERLRVHWDVPEILPKLQVPTLSIQPLVENAIRHGIEPSSTGGSLEILLRTDRQSLTLTVCNDLPDDGGKALSGHLVGLASVRERLSALGPGRQGQLDTRIENGRYFATITLPLPADAWADVPVDQVSTR